MRAAEAREVMRGLPVVDAGALAPDGLLVLAPHPDDETLGCGGLIATLCALGRPPAVMFVTDGAMSHPGSALFPPERLRRIRAQEARAACGVLGVGPERVQFLGLPDAAAPMSGPGFAASVDAMARMANAFGCGTVASCWRHDPHCDHAATAAMAAATGLRVVSYPVWGWLLPGDAPVEEVTGVRVSVEHVLERKRAALAAHRTQMGLITDAPDGFVIPDALREACVTPFEVFLEDAA